MVAVWLTENILRIKTYLVKIYDILLSLLTSTNKNKQTKRKVSNKFVISFHLHFLRNRLVLGMADNHPFY